MNTSHGRIAEKNGNVRGAGRPACRRYARLATAALAAALSLCLFWTPVAVLAAEATVTPPSVNVREEPSTSSGRVGSARAGEKFEIGKPVKGADGKDWYEVTLKNGRTGYIRGDLLSIADAEETVEETDEHAGEKPQRPEVVTELPEGAERQAAAQSSETDKQDDEDAGEETDAEEADAEDGEADGDDEPEDAEEAEEPEEPEEVPPYELIREEDPDGSAVWYLYDYEAGLRIRVSDLRQYDTLMSIVLEYADREVDAPDMFSAADPQAGAGSAAPAKQASGKAAAKVSLKDMAEALGGTKTAYEDYSKNISSLLTYAKNNAAARPLVRELISGGYANAARIAAVAEAIDAKDTEGLTALIDAFTEAETARQGAAEAFADALFNIYEEGYTE